MFLVVNWLYIVMVIIWWCICDVDGSDIDGGGQLYGWEVLIVIFCDYQGGFFVKIGDFGWEIVVKNMIWIEYEMVWEGDYILIGMLIDVVLLDEVDEIWQIVQFVDMFE